MKEIITDEEIEEAFERTDFSPNDSRKIIEQGVLKRQARFSTGGTLGRIMSELGLTSPAGTVTSKGRQFLFVAFRDKT